MKIFDFLTKLFHFFNHCDLEKKLQGLGGRKFKQKFPFGFKRLIPSFIEAEEKELVPVKRIDALVSIYTQTFYKTLANRNLLVDLQSTVDPQTGRKLAMRITDANKLGLKHYKAIHDYGLNKFTLVGKSSKAGSKISEELKGILGELGFTIGRKLRRGSTKAGEIS